MSIWAQRRVVEKPYDVGLRRSRYEPPRTKSYGFIPISIGRGVGPQGPQGKDGRNGIDGIDGNDGNDGKDGKDGGDGKQGPQGRGGKQGPPGRDGPQGRGGPPGPQGRGGKQGPPGRDGPQGPPGRDGPQTGVAADLERFENDNITDAEMREVGGVGTDQMDVARALAGGVVAAGNNMFSFGRRVAEDVKNIQWASTIYENQPRLKRPEMIEVEDPSRYTPLTHLVAGSSRDHRVTYSIPDHDRYGIEVSVNGKKAPPKGRNTYGLPSESSDGLEVPVKKDSGKTPLPKKSRKSSTSSSSSSGNPSGEEFNPKSKKDVDKQPFPKSKRTLNSRRK